MNKLTTTLSTELDRLEKDLSTLIKIKADNEAAGKLGSVTLDTIKNRINTISFCISELLELSSQLDSLDENNKVNGKEIVTGFIANSLTRLCLNLTLSTTDNIWITIPVLEKLEKPSGLNDEFDTLSSIVDKIDI